MLMISSSRGLILLAVISLMGGSMVSAQDSTFQYEGVPSSFEKVIEKTVSAQYLAYLPQGYEEGEKFPLLLFLHGAGERGDDIERVKIHGPMKFLAQHEQYPFILIAPQCPEGEWWSLDMLKALVDEIVEKYKVDEDRVYLTGLSMGGYGTWMLACEEPERFAALIPICGGGNHLLAYRIKQIPIWVFHGAQDTTVPLKASQDMVDAITQAGGNVKFTIYPEAGHDSWTETYNNPEIYDWLLSHTRSGRK